MRACVVSASCICAGAASACPRAMLTVGDATHWLVKHLAGSARCAHACCAPCFPRRPASAMPAALRGGDVPPGADAGSRRAAGVSAGQLQANCNAAVQRMNAWGGSHGFSLLAHPELRKSLAPQCQLQGPQRLTPPCLVHPSSAPAACLQGGLADPWPTHERPHAQSRRPADALWLEAAPRQQQRR